MKRLMAQRRQTFLRLTAYLLTWTLAAQVVQSQVTTSKWQMEFLVGPRL